MCVCVHSLRTPAIRISRIESIEWSVLQCSMSSPQTISMILGLSISPILSLKMIQRFLCHFWCLASQNLAPIWLPHWPPWIETSSRMAEIESKSERGDWEIGLCQKENTCVTTCRATYKSHTSNTCNTLAMKSRKIFLYFIRVGAVGLMELWRVVHWEGVCSKWANLSFPSLHMVAFLFLEGQMIGKAKFMFGRQPPDRV